MEYFFAMLTALSFASPETFNRNFFKLILETVKTKGHTTLDDTTGTIKLPAAEEVLEPNEMTIQSNVLKDTIPSDSSLLAEALKSSSEKRYVDTYFIDFKTKKQKVNPIIFVNNTMFRSRGNDPANDEWLEYKFIEENKTAAERKQIIDDLKGMCTKISDIPISGGNQWYRSNGADFDEFARKHLYVVQIENKYSLKGNSAYILPLWLRSANPFFLKSEWM